MSNVCEKWSFILLVLSATGGMANEATTFFKRLASLLAEKWDSLTLCWLRCRLSFSLLRSTIQAIRSCTGHAAAPHITAIDLITSESRLHIIAFSVHWTEDPLLCSYM